jgi:uncharacterized protein
MTTEALVAVDLEEELRFDCHPGVACFNACCRDLNQALTPYDVLRLRRHLGITSQEFLRLYTCGHIGPASGLPIISLRFDHGRQRACPFVTPAGCGVYTARPASCRLYPLARAVRRSRTDGRTSVHYALLREPHCRGFDQTRIQTVRSWIDDQCLEWDFVTNDDLMALIAFKNRLHPAPLSFEIQRLVRLALYDLDAFKVKPAAGELSGLEWDDPQPSFHDNDLVWLKWSMAWVRQQFSRTTE